MALDFSLPKLRADMLKPLRIQQEGDYRVRFVGKPVRLFVKWSRIGLRWNQTLISHEEYERMRKDLTFRDFYYNSLDERISERFVCNAIRRLMDGSPSMVVIEGSKSLYSQIADVAKSIGGEMKGDPGSIEHGWDFFIFTRGKGIKTQYEVHPVAKTPLTDAEKEYVLKNMIDLNSHYGAISVATMDKEQLRTHIHSLKSQFEDV